MRVQRLPIKYSADQRLLLMAMIMYLLAGCNRGPADWQNTYKATVVGDWEEARGTRERLHFEADGHLQMDSPSEHHSCTYDFPDSKHIRLDCLPAEIRHTPTTYGFALGDGTIMISDSLSTGTYKRKAAAGDGNP
jgi:hypothetical protein